MAQSSVVVGFLLIVLGVWGYWASDMVSVTALIPAFFGIVFVLLGMMAKSEARRKMVMHIAMVVALLGILGSIGGLIEMVASLMRGGDANAGLSLAVISRAIMSLTLIVYLVMGVRSFIAARRR